MFHGCVEFNQNLNKWGENTKNITEMDILFRGCVKFNKPLDKWNVARVTHMRNMFSNCTNFNQDISRWDVSQVLSMQQMFQRCTKFDQFLGDWRVGPETTTREIFLDCLALTKQPFNMTYNQFVQSRIQDTPFYTNNIKLPGDLPFDSQSQLNFNKYTNLLRHSKMSHQMSQHH